MGTSETVQPAHLSRLAVVYVRQPSPHQALADRESLKLPHDLRHHAGAAGWPPSPVRVLDADLGRTGRSAQGRAGFQELVALANQGQVGILFACDVTRLARNGTDWYALLDLCGWRSCLVGDPDGMYDPATPNGRLILGLKGLISELELHTLHARLTAGLLSKARRGELAPMRPAGLTRDELGRVVKHPARRCRAAWAWCSPPSAAAGPPATSSASSRNRACCCPDRTTGATGSGGSRPGRRSSAS
jgi:DNA invertase Pin-like site-specific DNA recombinase